MNRSRDSASTHAGDFRTFDDFLAHVHANVNRDMRFLFFTPDGREQYVSLAIAVEGLTRLKKFLGSPDLAHTPSQNDGRLEVSWYNYASLTQQLRWASGLDFDSRPKQTPGEFKDYAPRWSFAALLWFWVNGGDPLPGCTGDHATWYAKLPSMDRATHRRVATEEGREHIARDIPALQAGDIA